MKSSKKSKAKGSSRLKFDGRIADPFKFESIEELVPIPNKTYVLAPLDLCDTCLAQIIEAWRVKQPEIHNCEVEYYIHYIKKDRWLDRWVLET